MSRYVYVNGQYCNYKDSTTHVDDRGLQFSDGVYEVIGVWKSNLIDFALHIDRLNRSMHELSFSSVPSNRLITIVSKEIIRLNKINYGTLYIQVNRGISKRNHIFPTNKKYTMHVIGKNGLSFRNSLDNNGISAITTKDQRWDRRDIKSVSLLANVLAKQKAINHKSYESILFDNDNYVTEASTSNVWIVNQKNELVTHPTNKKILSGITRKRVLKIAEKLKINVHEKPFAIKDMYNASEVFLTGTTIGVKPVTKIDNYNISDCKIGPITLKLKDEYIKFLNKIN